LRINDDAILKLLRYQPYVDQGEEQRDAVSSASWAELDTPKAKSIGADGGGIGG
jgi:hypothetical protein